VLIVTSCGAPVDEPSTDHGTVPIEPSALQDWLDEQRYREWESWSEVGPTLGSGGARVYLSGLLVESLASGSEIHPEGAAAVRELYSEDFSTLTGYSALVKVEPHAVAASWLCFEQLSLELGAEIDVANKGAPSCAGCHGEGRDFIRSTLPLP
jgi:hypothetical protein